MSFIYFLIVFQIIQGSPPSTVEYPPMKNSAIESSSHGKFFYRENIPGQLYPRCEFPTEKFFSRKILPWWFLLVIFTPWRIFLEGNPLEICKLADNFPGQFLKSIFTCKMCLSMRKTNKTNLGYEFWKISPGKFPPPPRNFHPNGEFSL